jgi:glycosyltransferase involved in cell wall biosynthesis
VVVELIAFFAGMRIAMILDDPFPPDLRVEREAHALMSQGHEVHLLNFNVRNEQDRVFDHDGIRVTQVALGNVWYKLSALAYTLPFYHWKLRGQIRHFLSSGFDAVHVHDLKVARAVFYARPKGVRIVLDLHENRPEIMKEYPHLKKGLGRWLISPRRWQQFETRYINAADGVIVVTEEAAESYRIRPEIRQVHFAVVPNYTPLAFNPNGQPKNRPNHAVKLLYIGDTGERRGIMTALEAMAQDDRLSAVELHILGTSSFQPALQSFATEIGLAKRVHFHGWVSPDGFPRFLEDTHIGICPILRNPHHDTTYANKVFQYLAYGLPILVSDCPAQVAVVEKWSCGGVHAAGSAASFADALCAITAEPSVFEAISKAGIKAFQTQLNWEAATSALLGFYESELVH